MSVDDSPAPADRSDGGRRPPEPGDVPFSTPNPGESYFRAAAAILASLPEPLEPERAADLLRRHYGLSGSVETLSSEIERTSQVRLPDGRRLILKTAAAGAAALDSFRFQAAILAGLEGATGFLAPRLLRTTAGTPTFEDESVCGYLQTRVEGVPLHEAGADPDRLHRTGRALARLNLALATVDAPVLDRPILWHIRCWPGLMRLETYLPPGRTADLARAAMHHHAECVEPLLPELAWQVTHNDPSPFNIFVLGGDMAFIDFGDGCLSPRIQDLAIAAGHFVREPDLALGGAESLVAGYASQIPLSGLEAKLLVKLMRARQSALVLVNHWRASLFPADAAYIKKNVARAERGLEILARLSDAEAEAAVLAATSASPQ